MKTQDFKSDITRCFSRNLGFIWAVLAVALVLSPPVGHAQTFGSGSDGSDGALRLTRPDPDPSPGEPFVIEFDPGALGLDADGDHIFHFTTITIAQGVIVRLSAAQINGPVFWLASGAVQIDGIITLNGENGQGGQDLINESRRFAVPGAGGFAGGLGSTVNEAATRGFGPGGGGAASIPFRTGGGGGHAASGQSFSGHGVGGSAYGNDFLVPLVGGSGGGGGTHSGNNAIGGSGGAGGGALLIASSASIAIIGNIVANGGSGGGAFTSGREGGGGSGGAIHLLAPTINVAGALRALGGSNTSSGRIRVEAFQRTITGSINPLPLTGTPFAVFLPTTPASLRVVSVAGVSVPSNPTGSFTMPDVTINNVSPVDVVIEARNIPVGTVVQLHLLSETGPEQIVDSPPLAGTDALSTATASVTFPSGFSRGFVRATFGPPSP